MVARSALCLILVALAVFAAEGFRIKKFIVDKAKEAFDDFVENGDVTLPMKKYLARLKYPVEVHDVTTNDGYILTLFRIQAKGSSIVAGKTPVLFQHGLIASSDTWIINDEAKSPGLILANRGYDVWFANARGNYHSRRHVSLNPKDAAFWNFTWSEMAEKDLPATFKFIAGITQQKVNYIGHSQGTLSIFVALSLGLPDVVQNVGKVFALAPIAYLHHLKQGLIGQAGPFDLLGLVQTTPYSEILAPSGSKTRDALICIVSPEVCNLGTQLATGEGLHCVNTKRLPYVRTKNPAGTSFKNVLHFQQMMVEKHKILRRYDYGISENLRVYGQAEAPVYQLNQISGAQIYLFLGSDDHLSISKDVNDLRNDLGNNVKFVRTYQGLCHGSFMYGNDVSYIKDIISNLE
eukprot:TRINITY_DN1301_c0_g1_i1.p1 TRINITY_DN1301_c0_g1~~TRINITY_DN1301_c0_g1_i1.p1  ORF type:complete len:406 (-),score=107.78 TRINITY_DN1301_c0_g1_i1:151-1368(-)